MFFINAALLFGVKAVALSGCIITTCWVRTLFSYPSLGSLGKNDLKYA